MTAASNSEARKRAQEAASASQVALGATNGPDGYRNDTDVIPGAQNAIPDLDAIRARAEAATPGPWHWAVLGKEDGDE